MQRREGGETFPFDTVPEWQNDQQMSLLMAPFPDDPSTVDPESWKEIFEPRGLVALSLQYHALRRLAAAQTVVTLEDFQQSCLRAVGPAALGWGAWMAQPLTWVFRKLSFSPVRKAASPAAPSTPTTATASPRRPLRPPSLMLHPAASPLGAGTPGRRFAPGAGASGAARTPTAARSAAATASSSVTATPSLAGESDLLVCVPVVRQYAQALVDYYRGKQTSFTDLVLTRDEIWSQEWLPEGGALPRLSADDVCLAVMYAVREREATIVRMLPPSDAVGASAVDDIDVEEEALRISLTPGKALREAAPLDVHVASVKKAIRSLERRQEEFLRQISSGFSGPQQWVRTLPNQYTQKQLHPHALDALVRKYARTARPLALLHLRRRKAIAAVAEKEGSSLGNLHDVLLRIQSAHTEQEVVSAYENGSAALRSLVDVGRAERAADALLESMDQARQAEEAVQGVYNTLGLAEDSAELEEELRRLESEQEQQEAQAAAPVPAEQPRVTIAAHQPAVVGAVAPRSATEPPRQAREAAQDGKEAEEEQRRIEAEVAALETSLTEAAPTTPADKAKRLAVAE